MISEDYFLTKIKEIKNMRLLNFSKEAALAVYPRFKHYEEEDLEAAIDKLLLSDEKFDFSRLLRLMNNSRAARLEDESAKNKIAEAEAAREFFSMKAFDGECKREKCRGCSYLNNCKIRGREWLGGISAILRGGLGRKGAEELIRYMQSDFMGGVS